MTGDCLTQYEEVRDNAEYSHSVAWQEEGQKNGQDASTLGQSSCSNLDIGNNFAQMKQVVDGMSAQDSQMLMANMRTIFEGLNVGPSQTRQVREEVQTNKVQVYTWACKGLTHD
ncbi:unnamed protein product [Camellia sinensis]